MRNQAYLAKEGWQDLFDVLHIDFIDKTIEGLSQSVPGHALVLGTRLVIGFLHHLRNTDECCQYIAFRLQHN